jgi:hypothetical protein
MTGITIKENPALSVTRKWFYTSPEAGSVLSVICLTRPMLKYILTTLDSWTLFKTPATPLNEAHTGGLISSLQARKAGTRPGDIPPEPGFLVISKNIGRSCNGYANTTKLRYGVPHPVGGQVVYKNVRRPTKAHIHTTMRAGMHCEVGSCTTCLPVVYIRVTGPSDSNTHSPVGAAWQTVAAHTNGDVSDSVLCWHSKTPYRRLMGHMRWMGFYSSFS